ncbi:MAG TPA: CHAT domain-containing protein [Jatrophihabitans sp.]|uniref:CHAT domain-containing protein n=1 Tax=Jatrophihabitans sp. TaxID=1932789 RepID=UPI002DFC0144|nr:CHAT domain-containing protein [Jatrophihabitans sp.]
MQSAALPTGDPVDDARAAVRTRQVRLGLTVLVTECAKEEGFGERPVSAAVLLRRGPDGAIATDSCSVAHTVTGTNAALDEWLRARLAQAGSTAIVLGRAHTGTGQIGRFESVGIVFAEFEDSGGRFFAGAMQYRVGDGGVEWGVFREQSGTDRRPRVWPQQPQVPWPAADAPLRAEVERADALIERYLRTGASLFDLDAAIDTCAQLRRRYVCSPDSPSASIVLTVQARGMLARYQRIGDPTDVAAVLDHLRSVVDDAGCPADWRSAAVATLISALNAEYHRAAVAEVLDEAVQIGEHRLAELGGDTLADPDVAIALGRALLDRHVRYGLADDVLRVQDLIGGLTKVSWTDVPWSPGAFDLLGVAAGRKVGTLPDGGLRMARIAFAQVVQRQDQGYESFRYLAAYAGELVAAYRRDGEAEVLREALGLLADGLDVDQPELTPRLSWSSPYRRTLTEVWAEALRAARDAEPELAAQFDPGAHRLVRALEELVEFAPADSPTRASALLGLGSERAFREDWPGYRDAMIAASAAWDASFATSAIVGRLGMADLGLTVCRRTVDAYWLNANHSDDAEVGERDRWAGVAAGEAAKSRIYTESISRADLPAPPQISDELIGREQELVRRLTAIDNHDLAAEAGLDRVRARADAKLRTDLHIELTEVWTAIAELGPEAARYVASRRGEPLDGPSLRELVAGLGPRTACLTMLEDDDAVEFALIDSVELEPRLIRVTDRDFVRTSASRMWRELAVSRGRDRGHTWLEHWPDILELIARFTADVDRLIVSPHGAGFALPWAALARELDIRTGREVAVVTEPTLAALRVQARTDGVGPSLVIGDPLGDLPHAAGEADAVAALLGVAPLVGAAASVTAVEATAPVARIVHVAAHAAFDESDPLRSAVRLADGEWTARAILQSRLRAELVVLSACESGRAQPLRGSEVAGLGMALLQAGARRVITTLWPVDDEASAVFMAALYEALSSGADCIDAMRSAADGLRADARFRHPYFWAGYTLMGDPAGGLLLAPALREEEAVLC